MIKTMRTSPLLSVMAVFLAVAALAACTSTPTPAPTAAPAAPSGTKLEPAVLEGQSEHWKVNLTYLLGDKVLEEVTSVVYLSTEELNEVKVSITHKNQTPLTYTIVAPELLKAGKTLVLNERAKVLTWQETEQVVVEWKVGSKVSKEYVTPTKKS
jgi:hypothetical protein